MTGFVNKPPTTGKMFFELVSGREGPCLCMGDHESGYRIAGPKPWGGGSTQHRFVVDIAELKEAISKYEARHIAGAST